MGRLIRQSDIFNSIPAQTQIATGEQSVCLSACVVIFAAGFERYLEFDVAYGLPSRIGIHGPGQYDRSSGQYDSSIANREIQRVGQRLKTWFESVGVSTELVDDMFALPFDEIHVLSREELQHYGLYD